MKKLKTMLREIDNLEREILTRFSPIEIVKTIEQEEKKKMFWGACDGLIYVLWAGADNAVRGEEIENESI